MPLPPWEKAAGIEAIPSNSRSNFFMWFSGLGFPVQFSDYFSIPCCKPLLNLQPPPGLGPSLKRKIPAGCCSQGFSYKRMDCAVLLDFEACNVLHAVGEDLIAPLVYLHDTTQIRLLYCDSFVGEYGVIVVRATIGSSASSVKLTEVVFLFTTQVVEFAAGVRFFTVTYWPT